MINLTFGPPPIKVKIDEGLSKCIMLVNCTKEIAPFLDGPSPNFIVIGTGLTIKIDRK